MTTPTPSRLWPKLQAFSQWMRRSEKEHETWIAARREAADEARSLIKKGDAVALRALLAQWSGSLDPGLGPQNQDTLMGNAAVYGQTECAQTLLDHGYSVCSKDFWNQTPLDIAFNHHQIDFAKWALARGARIDLSTRHQNDSTIQYAAREGKSDGLELAIKRSNDPKKAKALALFYLVESWSRAAPAQLLTDLAFRPDWIDALLIADKLCERWNKRPLLSNAIKNGINNPQVSKAVVLIWLHEFERSNLSDKRKQRIFSSALREAAELPAALWQESFFEALWISQKKPVSATLAEELLMEATRLDNPEAISFILSRSGYPSSKAVHKLALLCVSTGGERANALWLERLTLTESEWQPFIERAAAADNVAAFKTMARLGAPLDSTNHRDKPLLETLITRPNAFVWLLDHLGLSDPLRLSALKQRVIDNDAGLVGTAFGSAEPILSAIDCHLLRAEHRVAIEESTSAPTKIAKPRFL